MKNKNLNVKKISIKTLLQEALIIPDGWKEEVFVENGIVEFSDFMTMPSETLDIETLTRPESYVGDIEDRSISEFEGFYERDDGKIEVVADDGQRSTETETYAKGKCYHWALITTREDSVDRIAEIIEADGTDPINILLEAILEH